MDLAQLPRDENGVVVGQWKLRHRFEGYSEGFGAFAFANGESTAPITGRVLEHAVATLGADIDVEPWDAPLEAAKAQEPDDGEPVVPTTRAELSTMSDDDLRKTAASLGCTDKRWGSVRLRRFIADELGMEEDDDAARE